MEKTHALVNVGSSWGGGGGGGGERKGAGRIGIIMTFALCLDETKNFEVLCATGMHTLQYAHTNDLVSAGKKKKKRRRKQKKIKPHTHTKKKTVALPTLKKLHGSRLGWVVLLFRK